MLGNPGWPANRLHLGRVSSHSDNTFPQKSSRTVIPLSASAVFGVEALLRISEIARGSKWRQRTSMYDCTILGGQLPTGSDC